jgi:type I restriction enzyme S subunit
MQLTVDWKIKTLGEIAEVQSGGTPLKSRNEYWFGDIPWYSSGELNETFTKAPKELITPKGLEESNAKLFPKGSLLIGMYDTAALKMSILDRDAAFNQAIAGVKPNEKIDLKFILYAVNSRKFEILNQRRGVRQKNLSLAKIKNIALPIPPLPEQKRIVAILDEAFEGIDRAIANTEKNLANSRELFESYLYIIFTQKGDRWEKVKPKLIPLSTLLSKQPRNGWSPPARFQADSGIPVLTLSAVTGFHYDGSRIKLTTAPTTEKAYYWLQEGELLITRSNTPELVGHVAIYDGNPTKAICPDLIMKMTVDHIKADTRFIYYFLRSATARQYLTRKAKGASSTMPKITKQVVQEIPIPTFNLTEQQAIVKKLDGLVAETQRLETIYRQKLAALNELKQSILQKAFTGELTADTPKTVKEEIAA